jgi:hypothetical protein
MGGGQAGVLSLEQPAVGEGLQVPGDDLDAAGGGLLVVAAGEVGELLGLGDHEPAHRQRPNP